MTRTRQFSSRLSQLVFIALIILATSGCTVQLVADYDAVTFEEIFKVGRDVDKFYGALLEEPSDTRQYANYTARYVSIEADIRSLVIRNQIRALNEESTEIAESILNLWLKYKAAHKAKDTYSDGNAKLDRNRFFRLFTAAASAEGAKRLDVEDRDATKDSK